MDKTDKTDKAGNIDVVDNTGNTDNTDKADNIDSIDNVDSIDKTAETDNADNIDAVDKKFQKDKKDKKELILNAMLELVAMDKGVCCSVSDIAKHAGIGKGSIYYYYSSKEEIFDAVVERYYCAIGDKCAEIADADIPPLEKLKILLSGYRANSKAPAIDAYLHNENNAAIHQKSLAKISGMLSPILAQIIKQGISDKAFSTDYPDEIAEIIMSVFAFLLDPGIFAWTKEQIAKKLEALSKVLECALKTKTGSFDFICESYF